MKRTQVNILLSLLIILVSLYIIKLCKLTGMCYVIISLLSPLFFGYIISWILKPLISKIKCNRVLSTIIIYLLFIGIIIFSLFKLIPLIIKETKRLYPIIKYYILHNKILLKIYNNIDIKSILHGSLKDINLYVNNIFSLIINIIYSLIFGFYFLTAKKHNNYFKFIPTKLQNSINKDLRLYLKSVLLDTIFMFIILTILFFIIGLDSPILFALLCAITNIIPYIGPYIGGIPSVLIGLTSSLKKGIIVSIVIVLVQLIENSIIQPIIVSKNVNLNPIFILIGIIIFSHFLGIIGMIISTPIILIIRNIIIYYKKNKPKWFNLILDKL